MRVQSRTNILRITVASLGGVIFLLLIRHLTFESWPHVADLLIFTIFIAVGELLNVNLPQGGMLSMSSAVIIAALVLYPLPEVLLITAVGVTSAIFIKRKKVNLGEALFWLGEKTILIVLAAVFYRLLGGTAGEFRITQNLVSLLGLCLVYFAAELTWEQFFFSLRRDVAFKAVFKGSSALLVPAYVALSSLGLLIALMYKYMSVWSLPLLFFPLLVIRYSFKLLLDIKETYKSTIRALATAIEVQDPARRGHAERVAECSISLARELGIHGDRLEQVGNAALLHDIGRIGVDEESLDSLLETANSENGLAPHAVIGAEIVDQVKYLRPARYIVQAHHKPYDGTKRSSDPEHPLGARIIHVASYYDELTHAESSEERLTPRQAVERIKKDQGIRFDPRVVRSLINVLRRQGQLLSIL